MSGEGDSCCVEAICDPIKNYKELIDFEEKTSGWCYLVEPLQKRSTARYFGEKYHDFSSNSIKRIEENERPEILVCHDYKGNYLCDKYVNGASDWQEYRFYNWSCADIFCYFSHYFVTIPTLQFLNCAHKHGVKVIGTFIVEGTEGFNLMNEEILTDEINVKKVARKLANLCKVFKFEGWLLNVECSIKPQKVSLLKLFVKKVTQYTHELVPDSRVIWYDSVTISGALNWQNELNVQNEDYFKLCDGIFLNYGWKDEHLQRTDAIVKSNYPKRRKDVFFGIDIFGRGQLAQFDTNQTLSKIDKSNFSTAFFAVGWTHETMHFKRSLDMSVDETNLNINKIFFERNDTFWNSLWQYLPTFGPAQLPFHTTFCVGSGKQKCVYGKVTQSNPWYNLRRQNYQLSVPTARGIIEHDFENSFHGGSSLRLESKKIFRLFSTDFKTDKDIILICAFKPLAENVSVNFYMKLFESDTEKYSTIVCGSEIKNDSDQLFVSEIENDDELKTIFQILPQQSEFLNVGRSSINDWHISYFHVKFESKTERHVIDIGVKKSGDGPVLLGGLSVYEIDSSKINKDTK